MPELITGDAPIGVDASAATIDRVSKESALYYSFAAEAGTSYRVTLQPVSRDADITLLDNQILSDQSIVGFAQSNGSLADVFYDAIDDRTVYIEVSTLNGEADFKLYVNRLSTISTKLKIFVTSETHNGSLASDTTLIGSNAIEKADYICRTSAEKPDDKEYKALLVDGLYRDAPALTDWVLQPDTTYYRIDGVVPIATTNSDAIFALASQGGRGSDLVNAVGLTGRQVWTGAADVGDFFTLFFSNCGGWAATTGSKGVIGISTSSSSTALGTTTSDCSSEHAFYCVQQL
ncbi:MAG TPA: DUF1554 domain-containing protein [Gammaproteobacteria bacterium]|nr:DUF1554 domain-containing protein [Gammaproteobacteria bacterium]